MVRFRQIGILFFAAAAFTGACNASPGQGTGTAETVVREEEGQDAKAAGTSKESPKAREPETKEPETETAGENLQEGTTEPFRGGVPDGSTREYIGIYGHIKEILEGRALIKSDTDDFPGVFWVLYAEDLNEVREGDGVFVLMEDTGQKEDGIELYRADTIFRIPDTDDEPAEADVLLTSAPDLRLSDPLSSVLSFIEIQPGSYSWNTADSGVVACGAAPLDQVSFNSAPRLKLPHYNGADTVLYGCSSVCRPDKMVVRQWDVSEAGNTDAVEEQRIVYYCISSFVELKRGKIYEISLEWNEEHQKTAGFWGTAQYLFVTE